MEIPSWCAKLSSAIVRWLRYNIVFCKAVPFISGDHLVQRSHSLLEKGVVGILVDYVAQQLKKANLAKIAAVVNVQAGLSAVMMILLAHISDTCTGRFKMVLYSTLAYVFNISLSYAWGYLQRFESDASSREVTALGLCLLYYSSITEKAVDQFFYLAMVPIALGIAGRNPPLDAFLGDQVRRQEPDGNINEERVRGRVQFWSRLNKFLGAFVAFLVLGQQRSWKGIFKISAIVMAISGLLFVCGFPCYHREKPTGSILTDVYLVFKAAIWKRHLEYPTSTEQLYLNTGNELEIVPHVAILRWLDKAAIKETSSLNPELQERSGKLCRVAKVNKVKLLLTMVPMWITFLIYCLVVATGSTFFILQGSDLDFHIGKFQVPMIYLFSLIRSFSSFMALFLYELLIPKLLTSTQQIRAWKVRIGMGMFCSFLSCVAARIVEMHRLKSTYFIPINGFWLIPQFCFLGLMEGLCEDGLVDFYYNQVPESVKSYGPPFNQVILGLGTFLSILWILTFKQWFGETINESRLDNYYAMLAIVSLGNQFVYWYVCNMQIYNIISDARDVEMEETPKDGVNNPTSESSIPQSRPSIPNSTQITTVSTSLTEHNQSRCYWSKIRETFRTQGFSYSKLKKYEKI